MATVEMIALLKELIAIHKRQVAAREAGEITSS
jgi:hypothetical protein